MSLQTKDLTTKAMLVSLNITQWTAKKYDKNASGAVQEKFQAEQKAGQYRKRLAAKDFLSEVNSVISEARDFFKENTRPWSDDGGYRILPSKNYIHMTGKIREYQSRFEVAVNNLTAKYDQMKADAKQFLGDLYSEDDYPDASEIKSKYSFKMGVMPIPTVNDFRVTQITDEDVNAIKQQISDQMEQVNRNLMRDLWDRLYTVLETALKAFEDPDMKFHDSKVDNISQTIIILRRLNMEDDPKLERMCKLVESRICNLDPAELRKEPVARKEAATDAKKLLDAMSAYC